jgi:LAO/AO transport system kinase
MADISVTQPPTEALAERVRAGDRAALAKAITLVESRRADHQAAARGLVQALLPHSGGAIRLGITGPPGVGKSTLIDRLGLTLAERGHRIAVLAVDPSSSRAGGAILGDKTRMAELSAHSNAFIRPSPSSGTLGGTAARTREAMLLCEAAGFDVVIVETVGVGQSETAVADMVDTFLLLMLPGAGDELQGLKKGVIELADMIAVTKADGASLGSAQSAAAALRGALAILAPSADWPVPVLLLSAITDRGLDDLWATVEAHRARMDRTGQLAERRARQQVGWLRVIVEERLTARLYSDPAMRRAMRQAEEAVAAGRLAALVAADQVAALAGA